MSASDCHEKLEAGLFPEACVGVGYAFSDKGKERALLKFDMLKSTLFNDVVMDEMASLA